MKFTSTRLTLALLLIVAPALFLGQGCSSEDSSSTAPVTNPPPPGSGTGVSESVTIDNFAFTPASLTINVGTTVVWTNNQNVGHTVTSDTGDELESGLLQQGRSFSHTFNTAGVFPYHCTPHPDMKGTVTVQP
jgi:plastocyanin